MPGGPSSQGEEAINADPAVSADDADVNGAVDFLFGHGWSAGPNGGRAAPQVAGKLFVRVERLVDLCVDCGGLRTRRKCREDSDKSRRRRILRPPSVYLHFEVDGCAKTTQAVRSGSSEALESPETVCLDVVEFYGPTPVEASLWESRLLGPDVLLGSVSIPLADAHPGPGQAVPSEGVPPHRVCLCKSQQALRLPLRSKSLSVSPPRLRRAATTSLSSSFVSLRRMLSTSSSSSQSSLTTTAPTPAASVSVSAAAAPTAAAVRSGYRWPVCCANAPQMTADEEAKQQSPDARSELKVAEDADYPGGTAFNSNASTLIEVEPGSADDILAVDCAMLQAHPGSIRKWFVLKPSAGALSTSSSYGTPAATRRRGVAMLVELHYLTAKGCITLNRDTGMNELHRAALRGRKEVMQTVLKEIGPAAMCLRSRSGLSALDYCVLRGSPVSTRLLLEHAGDRFFADGHAPSPLHLAVRGGNLEVLRLLLLCLRRRAAVGSSSSLQALEAGDEAGRTPMALAVELGRLEVAQMLLKRGANPAAKDPDGETPLMVAARKGRLPLVRLLLQQRNFNATQANHGDQGAAPPSFLLPSPRGHSQLASYTALPCAFSKVGDSALLLAARHGQADIVRALLAIGAPAALPNKQNRTALHEAAQNGHLEVVGVLIEHVCSTLRRKEVRKRKPWEVREGVRAAWIAAQDVNGKTPLMLALENGHDDVASLLLFAAPEIERLGGVLDGSGRGECGGKRHEKAMGEGQGEMEECKEEDGGTNEDGGCGDVDADDDDDEEYVYRPAPSSGEETDGDCASECSVGSI